MFRNPPPGGTATAVGPNLSTGVQSSFPLDVVPVGGFLQGVITAPQGEWTDAQPFVVVPAGKFLRLHSMCDPIMVFGADSTAWWAVSISEVAGYSALISPAHPFALCGGMVFDPAAFWVFNGTTDSDVLNITYDAILPPDIQ